MVQRRRPPRRLPRRVPWRMIDDSAKQDPQDGTLVVKEEMNEDEVRWSTYWAFINAGGILIFLTILLAQLGGQAVNVYASFWLTDWGANTLKFEYTYQRQMPLSRSLFWYNGYAGLLMASVLLVTIRYVSWVIVL